MRTVVTIALLIALWLCVIGHGAAAHATAVPSDAINGSEQVVALKLQPDGNARVSVIRNMSIEGEYKKAAFKEKARRWEKLGVFDKRGESSTGFLALMMQATDRVSNESNRSMRITNVTNTTAIRGDSGLFYRNFTWTNFTEPPESGRPVNLKESFTTGNGTWIKELEEGQTLVIIEPKGYELNGGRNVDHDGQNYYQYTGSRLFTTDTFDITYQKVVRGPPEEGINFTKVLIGLLALVVGSIGALVLSRRRTLIDRVSTDRDLGLPGGTTTDTVSEDEIEPDIADGGAVVDHAEESTAASSGVDVELLSDEERVERLLRHNGGRMRQATIVTETGWSDAKVSQLLSAMDEDERIEKLRIGRENLISLPDYDISGDVGPEPGSDPDHA